MVFFSWKTNLFHITLVLSKKVKVVLQRKDYEKNLSQLSLAPLMQIKEEKKSKSSRKTVGSRIKKK